jgi:ABC-2 type transport system permease protein
MSTRSISTMWTLMRRELWESPGAFKWAPITILGLTLFFIVFGLILGSRFDNEMAFTLDAIRQFADVPADQKRLFVTGALFAVSGLFFQILLLVLLFYLSSCLYDERKDRSILFWKSLPVSDTMTVASKVLTACLLAPAIYLVIVVITQLIVLLIATVYGFMAGINPFTAFWLPASLPKLWSVMALGLVIQGLWLLPVYAWLVFCSSWAPRVPILVAVAVPAVISLLQHAWSLLSSFTMPELNVGLIILKRLGSGILPSNIGWRVESNGNNIDLADVEFSEELFMSFSNSLEYLARPEMWVGIGIALALLAGSIWFRRRATDT